MGALGRRTIRLQDFDYTNEGAYFLTICAYQRLNLFGGIDADRFRAFGIGKIVLEEWLRTPFVRPDIILDEYVVMPNHFHAIVLISKPQLDSIPMKMDARVGAHGNAPKFSLTRRARSIATLVSGFKGAVTRRVRADTGCANAQVWQRNYYEHVIRNELDLAEKRAYIADNPRRWEEDEYWRK